MLVETALGLLLNLKLFQTLKDCWASGIFFSCLRLFSCGCWCLKAGCRRNSLATQVILLCLVPKLLSLSAFPCLAFHFGKCTWKAKHVNSTRETTPLEWRRTLTPSHARKCQNNSPGNCSRGETVPWPCSIKLTTLRVEPWDPLGS